jgi:hypothetical protein
MSNVPINIFRNVIRRNGGRTSNPPALDGVNPDPVNPEGTTGGPALPDTNKVSYNLPDNKNATERAQARENIGAFGEAVERESNTVVFDQDYIIGNEGVRSGNILFDFTDAKLGAVTMMAHNSNSIPTIPATGIVIGGNYLTGVNNFIYFLCVKKSSPQIVHVTISQIV